MKKSLITTLTFLLIAALATAFVAAELQVNTYTNDFSVTSPYADAMKACACESRADRLTVTNTGNFYTGYTVDVIADQPWFRPGIEAFTLAPGESQEVIVYVEPPCGTIASERYSVRIASSYGRERIVTRSLDIKQCQNLFLTVEGGSERNNLCQPLTYGLTLKNVAEFADTFHLDFGPFDEQADLERRDYYLLPDQSEELNVTITPPCSLYGDVTIPFTLRSEKNKVMEKRTADVRIENEFDHEIGLATQQEVCSRVASEYSFNVTNLIDVPNTYDVMVSGPGFVDYGPKRLSLDGHETKQVALTLDPKKGQEGTYRVTATVRSDLGDIRKSREMELDVFDCYAFTPGLVDLPPGTKGTYTDEACCGAKTYTLNIRNSGQTEELYRISTEGPSWFRPEESTIRLKPSENRNVRIEAELPCSDQSYEIPVTVSLDRHPEISETILLVVDSQTQETCHAVELSAQNIRLNEEETLIPFLVRNVGLEGGAYRVTVDGELYDGSLEREVDLLPGEEALLHLKTRENVSDYFDGKYLGTVTLTHEGLGLVYSQPFWTRFVHNTWLVKAWRGVVNYDYGAIPPCAWLALLLLILLVLALAALGYLLSGGRKLRWLANGTLLSLRVAIAALFVLALVLLATAKLPQKAELYEQPIEDASGLVFQWYENSRMTIDLSQYFDDPDGDWLEYTATQPAHVAVTIRGSEATLTPERNWAGEDTIVFTASDQNGGIADSPALALKVLRRKELSFGQWLVRYCAQVNLALLSLILIVLGLIALLAMEPRKRIPYGEVIEPPKRPRGKAVQTRVTRKGQVRKLGEQPKRRGRPRKGAGKSAIRPGQEIVATAGSGGKRVIGVAEKVAWPEAKRGGQAAAVGNTVNIAVGASGVSVPEPKELILVGAKNGNKVHDPQCIVAQRIPRKNRVAFTSKAAAVKAGYGPCKVCQAFDKA